MGEILFKIRGYTPLPFFLISILYQQPQQGLITLGLILIAFGELLRLWGVSYAGSATRTRKVGAPELVTNGPYAHLRNPLYLGNIFMYCGVVIAFGGWLPHLLYLVIFFFSWQYIQIVKVEEKKLRELFGTKFERYAESVSRFLPRLSAYPERSKVKPNFINALRSEKSTFMVIGALVILFIIRAYWIR
jgi:protein-S-isoprenylcysteine O-methyltransferase Ste14